MVEWFCSGSFIRVLFELLLADNWTHLLALSVFVVVQVVIVVSRHMGIWLLFMADGS